MVNEYDKLQKIFSALEMPMDEEERIDYKNLEKLINYELSIGVEGFYCMGSSGEGLLLSNKERKEALEQIVKITAERVPIIAQIGSIRTKDVIELAKHAVGIGVTTVSMIPPYYYKFSMEEIIKYYEDVIEAVPGIQVIIYNIPQFTGIEFSKQNADRLLRNPAVVGVKHTSHNLYSLERMVREYPDKVFFNGFDEQYLAALSMGASAAIGTSVNCYAPLFLKIRKFFMEQNYEKAYQAQAEVNDCIEVMVKHGIFNAVKYILSKRGITCGQCRKPFMELSKKAMEELDRIVSIDGL
ncbi:MAG TPA: N-acetylneuraminate lyase [Lachnospiraceae bacterium]